MPKTKQVDALAEVAVQLKTLTDAFKALNTRVDRLETPEPKKEDKKSESKAVNSSVSKYQEMVNTILNHNFDFRVEEGSNPAFLTFTVLVPKKYSNAPEPYWEMYHEDPRPRAMSVREMDIMLKDHLEKVFNNFSSDVKALIVNDRDR